MGGFERTCERKTQRDGRISRSARNNARSLVAINVGQEPVDALVDVAEPRFQARDGLAVRGEAEMTGLDDARVYGADGNLMQALPVHRLKRVVDRIAQRCRFCDAKRRTQSPRAVIEPWACIGSAGCDVAVEIGDRPLEPDRRRVILPNRRETAVLDRKRHDRGQLGRRPQRHMHGAAITPQSEQIAVAFSERCADRLPGCTIDFVTRPGPVVGDGDKRGK